MDIRDIMAEPTGVKRPEHPDFWMLSEIILALKATMEETKNDPVAQEAAWRASYEELGDFDSIAYAAIQAGLELHGVQTGADWMMLVMSGRQESYVKTVQAFFDGFLMGSKFTAQKAQ